MAKTSRLSRRARKLSIVLWSSFGPVYMRIWALVLPFLIIPLIIGCEPDPPPARTSSRTGSPEPRRAKTPEKPSALPDRAVEKSVRNEAPSQIVERKEAKPATSGDQPSRPPALPSPRNQSFDKALQEADKLLAEARAVYQKAKIQRSSSLFTQAAFKVEQSKIKYQAVTELGEGKERDRAKTQIKVAGQLLKLINDGKAAVTRKVPSNPAAAPSPAPVPDSKRPAAAAPRPNTPVPPAALPPEAPRNKRLIVPAIAAQRKAEKIVRELFKDEYKMKLPAERQALAETLLERGNDQEDDSVAKWVFLREAREVAVKAGDVETAWKAVDAMTESFELEPLPLKLAVLDGVAKAARTTDKASELASRYLVLTDEADDAEKFSVAKKAASQAAQLARRARNAVQSKRATVRLKQITYLRSRFERVQKALQKIKESPSDPAASLDVGQYHAFDRGDWAEGLPYLAKGSNAELKGLAERDLSSPTLAQDQAAVAEAWWTFSLKERTPSRKRSLAARAFLWYSKAQSSSGKLLSLRIEKRLTEIGAVAFTPVDLLALIDLKKDIVTGMWKFAGSDLVGHVGSGHTIVQIPYAPPDEYDVKLVTARTKGNDAVEIGLAAQGRQFQVVIDGWGGTVHGIDLIDGVKGDLNETKKTGKIFRDSKTRTIIYSVRKDVIRITVDRRLLLEWKPDYSRLSLRSDHVIPESRGLFVCTHRTEYRIKEALLLPLSGQGQSLR